MKYYQQFVRLHQGAAPIVIANAWNVKSARLIEKMGYQAIVTSSGAIADSLGYEDGEKIPFEEVLYLTEGALQDTVEMLGRFKMSRANAIAKVFEHQAHHRRQTTVYVRLAGVTPPQEQLF